MDGPYNTVVCKWDGGDRCEVTCKKTIYGCSGPFQCDDPTPIKCNITEGETWCETLQTYHKNGSSVRLLIPLIQTVKQHQEDVADSHAFVFQLEYSRI